MAEEKTKVNTVKDSYESWLNSQLAQAQQDKTDAYAQAATARQTALQDAQNTYAQGKATYGQQAEIYGRNGLALSGNTDYASQSNYAAYLENRANAYNTEATAQQNANTNYSSAVNTANSSYQQMLASYNSSRDSELANLAASGYYTAEQMKVLSDSYGTADYSKNLAQYTKEYTDAQTAKTEQSNLQATYTSVLQDAMNGNLDEYDSSTIVPYAKGLGLSDDQITNIQNVMTAAKTATAKSALTSYNNTIGTFSTIDDATELSTAVSSLESQIDTDLSNGTIDDATAKEAKYNIGKYYAENANADSYAEIKAEIQANVKNGTYTEEQGKELISTLATNAGALKTIKTKYNADEDTITIGDTTVKLSTRPLKYTEGTIADSMKNVGWTNVNYKDVGDSELEMLDDAIASPYVGQTVVSNDNSVYIYTRNKEWKKLDASTNSGESLWKTLLGNSGGDPVSRMIGNASKIDKTNNLYQSALKAYSEG